MRSPGLATVEPADHRVVLRILAKRNGDLGRERNLVANRLHALLCELAPAGITKEIRASAAQAVLDGVVPTSPAASARHAMALELLDDVRRLDAQLAESKRRIADAVAASKTSLTDVFGVGPVIAAMCIGFTGDVRRFATTDRFAAYTGTAPREVSSGGHQVFRLSRRGNRRLNHAIHMAAVTQLRHAHSPGRAFYDRKLAEGKSRKMALRALKRRISDVIYRQLLRVPAAVHHIKTTEGCMKVMIGVDPHKQSHQAVAIDGDEGEVARLEVRAHRKQVSQLLGWAERFEARTWAMESAGGLGYLLAQQLVDAGEYVVDVPATLASRVRLLGSGHSSKNDTNDARSVAVAALRAADGGGRRRPSRRAPSLGQAERRSRTRTEPGRQPPPRPVVRARPGRNHQETQGF
jgi:transposase